MFRQWCLAFDLLLLEAVCSIGAKESRVGNFEKAAGCFTVYPLQLRGVYATVWKGHPDLALISLARTVLQRPDRSVNGVRRRATVDSVGGIRISSCA